MSNPYFNVSGAPASGSPGASAVMRSEFTAIATGFDKLPTLAGNAGRPVVVNSGATALEAGAAFSMSGATLTLLGQALFTAGSASAPGAAFVGDANNGWWSPAADQQAWSLAGAEVMRLTSTGWAYNTSVYTGSNLQGVTAEPYAGGVVFNVGHTTGAASGDSYINFRRGGTTLGNITQVSSNGLGIGSTGDLVFVSASAEAARFVAGSFFIGATGAAGAERLGVQESANSSRYILMRNANAGASAGAGVILNASGNSWNVECGSSAKNSNNLSFYVDALGSPIARLSLTTDGRLFGSALHNNAGAMTGTTNQYIGSGTYTPTLTNGANVAASTARVCHWIRVGNVVHVSGSFDVDATAAAGTATVLSLSLPIASDLAAVTDLGGVAASSLLAGGTTATAGLVAPIQGDATNNRATAYWNSGDTNNVIASFTFSYVVL